MEEQEQYVHNQWLEWFWANADFGPAHGDVLISMMERFEKETGEILPSSVKEGYC